MYLLKGDFTCALDYLDRYRTSLNSRDYLLSFKVTVQRKDYDNLSSFSSFVKENDEVALLLINEAIDIMPRNTNDAEVLLDFVFQGIDDDYGLWYKLGNAYERLGYFRQLEQGHDNQLPDGTVLYSANDQFDKAEIAYFRGIQIENLQKKEYLTEGNYLLGWLFYRLNRWDETIQILSPLLEDADDKKLQQPVGTFVEPEVNWQGSLLIMGISCENLGNYDCAINAYQRLIDINSPVLDWTIVQAHLKLAELESKFENAEDIVMMHYMFAFDKALLLGGGLGDGVFWSVWFSYIDYAKSKESYLITDLLNISSNLVQQLPNNPGGWIVYAVLNEASCNTEIAISAYNQAMLLTKNLPSDFNQSILPVHSEWTSCNY